jgi:hypothetical protein
LSGYYIKHGKSIRISSYSLLQDRFYERMRETGLAGLREESAAKRRSIFPSFITKLKRLLR